MKSNHSTEKSHEWADILGPLGNESDANLEKLRLAKLERTVEKVEERRERVWDALALSYEEKSELLPAQVVEMRRLKEKYFLHHIEFKNDELEGKGLVSSIDVDKKGPYLVVLYDLFNDGKNILNKIKVYPHQVKKDLGSVKYKKNSDIEFDIDVAA